MENQRNDQHSSSSGSSNDRGSTNSIEASCQSIPLGIVSAEASSSSSAVANAASFYPGTTDAQFRQIPYRED